MTEKATWKCDDQKNYDANKSNNTLTTIGTQLATEVAKETLLYDLYVDHCCSNCSTCCSIHRWRLLNVERAFPVKSACNDRSLSVLYRNNVEFILNLRLNNMYFAAHNSVFYKHRAREVCIEKEWTKTLNAANDDTELGDGDIYEYTSPVLVKKSYIAIAENFGFIEDVFDASEGNDSNFDGSLLPNKKLDQGVFVKKTYLTTPEYYGWVIDNGVALSIGLRTLEEGHAKEGQLRLEITGNTSKKVGFLLQPGVKISNMLWFKQGYEDPTKDTLYYGLHNGKLVFRMGPYDAAKTWV